MLVIGNLKMYMTYEEVKSFIDNFDEDVVLCPSSIFVPYFLNHKYKVGIQDISMYDLGSHTGEISAKQAKQLGVSYSIVGHSERRKYNKETDEEINKKVINGLENGLKVILCVGENKGENKEKIISSQVLNALKDVDDVDNLIIAYEPVWCIGTGITPTNNQIGATINFIQTIIEKKFNKCVKVVYGGSVDKDNINILKKVNNLSGFLIGKAATDYKQFKMIVTSLKD